MRSDDKVHISLKAFSWFLISSVLRPNWNKEERRCTEKRRCTWERWMSPSKCSLSSQKPICEGCGQGKMWSPPTHTHTHTFSPQCTTVKVEQYWKNNRERMRENERALPGGKKEQVKLNVHLAPQLSVSQEERGDSTHSHTLFLCFSLTVATKGYNLRSLKVGAADMRRIFFMWQKPCHWVNDYMLEHTREVKT